MCKIITITSNKKDLSEQSKGVSSILTNSKPLEKS